MDDKTSLKVKLAYVQIMFQEMSEDEKNHYLFSMERCFDHNQRTGMLNEAQEVVAVKTRIDLQLAKARAKRRGA